MNNRKKGWVKLYRQMLDSGIWGNPQLVVLWIWCLLRASSSKQTVVMNGKKIKILPGQFITGRKAASEETGIPESTIYKYMKLLESMNMLKRTCNNRYTIVTIVNWTKYQGEEEKRSKLRNNRGTTDDTAGDTTREHIQEIYKGEEKSSPLMGENFSENENQNDSDVNGDDDWDWDWDKIPDPEPVRTDDV